MRSNKRLLRFYVNPREGMRKHNLMAEVLSLQRQLADKNAEIQRLHEIIARVQEGRRALDFYLQEWVLKNPSEK